MEFTLKRLEILFLPMLATQRATERIRPAATAATAD
jgi:hypothetical protein